MKSISIVLLVFLTTNLFAQSVPSYVPTSGLIGWWPFTGNANDSSGNGNNGTITGATLTTDRFGASNNAYYFHGNTDGIDVGNNSSLNVYNSFSISGYFKTDSFNKIQGILTREGNTGISSTPWLIRLNFNKLSLWLGNGSTFSEFYTNFSYDTGVWYHFAVTFNDTSNQVKMYINGLLDTTINTSQNCFSIASTRTKIGTQQLTSNVSFSGKLDDIGIWGRTLSAAEIGTLYHPSTTGFEQFNYHSEVAVYPNPANDVISIGGQFNKIEISDLAGRIIILSSENKININQLNTGLYLVKVIGNDDQIIKTEKIYKK